MTGIKNSTLNRDNITRFIHEIDIMSRLSHPALLKIHDYGYFNADMSIVSEYFDHPSQEPLLRSGREFSFKLMLDIFIQLAGAASVHLTLSCTGSVRGLFPFRCVTSIKSILCIPISFKDSVKAVLYLDNSVSSFAVPDEILKIVSVILKACYHSFKREIQNFMVIFYHLYGCN